MQIQQTAVLGAGVIGASWTSLFLAAGMGVDIYDPMPNAKQRVRDYITNAWPTLEALGMTERGDPNAFCCHTSLASAVEDAQFIQECVPERLSLKRGLFAEMEPHLLPEAVVASSASGLMVSEMQQGWQDPSRFILGHPFNPPHLIPLVELVANDKTADGVLEIAEAFYKDVGKVTIRVQREVPAHVANRLQAALWKEAIYLVESGVASVEDVDKAIWAGPGLRWAAEGPHMLFHLAAGPGGLGEFCNRYGESFQRWWDDLGDTKITPELAEKLMQGIEQEGGAKTVAELATKKDALITGILQATMPLRKG